jgi:glycosyltransferase involved in cell wall biosynthesis
MRIAVNTGSLKTNLFETFIQLAKLHPQQTFLFFFDKENNYKDFPENVSPVIIQPAAKISLNWRIWYNLKLPSSLKKNKADVFISEKYVSLKTKIPQLLIAPDLTYIHYPSFVDKKQISFYKKNTPKFLERANKIIVYSFFFKKEIAERFKINEEKINVIYPVTKKNLATATFEEKELIKEKYAEGNEYFIYNGIISPKKNLINLLKAFSFFKKRQRSKMQLLILGKPGEKYEEFVRSLESYRFKNDVKLLEKIPSNESEKILASAYAMVYVPFYEIEGDEVIEAMQSGIPLIVSDTQFLKEYCADAALYVEPANPKDIAEKMMLLFKDEQKRKELIENGRSQIEKFSGKKRDEILFELIENETKKIPLS